MNKTKSFRLIDGRVDDWYWSIDCVVKLNDIIEDSGANFMLTNLANSRHENMTSIQIEVDRARGRNENMTEKQIVKSRTYHCKWQKNITDKQRQKYNMTERLWSKNNQDKVRVYRSRDKGLGHIPLNNWFIGCHGHHLNDDYIIYIPTELHRSVYHDREKDINMVKMNNLAIDFMISQDEK